MTALLTNHDQLAGSLLIAAAITALIAGTTWTGIQARRQGKR